ncbi:MAG: hypothetical protein E5V77_01030 [Mesorhizobium sp.]|nr:MAG: hypothetical protein E5V77_01030 [Mesorhizobium sp.]
MGAVPVFGLLGSMLSVQIGAAFAKGLFPVLGPEGTTMLRLAIGALMLAAVLRPWKVLPSRRNLPWLAAYGITVCAMNLLFYAALQRIPLGICVALEFTGPLFVATLGSRRLLDLVWVGLAIAGIALLSPLTHLEARIGRRFDLLYVPSPLLRRILAYTAAIPLSLRYAQPTLRFIFAPQAVPADYMIAGGGWLGLRPSHYFATSTDVVAVERDLGQIERRYRDIAMPAGILFGTGDRVIGEAVHGEPMLDEISGLDFERVEGLGHMPQFIEPERVVAFIQRVAARGFANAR